MKGSSKPCCTRCCCGAFIVICLVVGCGLFFKGCDEDIWPICNDYTKVNSIVSRHLITLNNCTICLESQRENCARDCSRTGGTRRCSKNCNTVCVRSESYICYSSYAVFIGGSNRTCMIDVDTNLTNNSTMSQKLNTSYPIGFEHTTYFTDTGKCSLGPTAEERNMTRFGLACLVIFGISVCCIGLLAYAGIITVFKKKSIGR